MEELKADSFAQVDIALFSAGGTISAEFCPIAASSGALVIDNSSTFRMEKDVPLVVPEVNAKDCAEWRARGIIANPNCSTIQLVPVLRPLHELAGLRRVVISTYQSASGAGRKAMDELTTQVQDMFAGKDPQARIFPHPIAFNCLPQIDKFLDNGYTKEEWKLVEESRKILGLPDLAITATAVRVPVYVGHSESVWIETEQPLDLAKVRETLRTAPGLVLEGEPDRYPLARQVAGSDAIHVGRVRLDPSVPHGIACWIVADNLRKGAALNAVQIAEVVISKYLA